jgi:hypothetical protein
MTGNPTPEQMLFFLFNCMPYVSGMTANNPLVPTPADKNGKEGFILVWFKLKDLRSMETYFR